jgi:hypothetical protein
MATVLAYAMDQAYTSPRRTLLIEFRQSERVQRLFERGLLELESARRAAAAPTQTASRLEEAHAESVLSPSGTFRLRNVAMP